MWRSVIQVSHLIWKSLFMGSKYWTVHIIWDEIPGGLWIRLALFSPNGTKVEFYYVNPAQWPKVNLPTAGGSQEENFQISQVSLDWDPKNVGS